MIEVLFSIYLVSGIIKNLLLFYEVDVFIDLTLLLGVLLAISILYKILIAKKYDLSFSHSDFIKLFPLVLFYLWCIISAYYLSPGEYGYLKVILFSTNLLAFLLPCLHKTFNYKLFFQSFCIISIFLGLYYVEFYSYVKEYSIFKSDNNVDLRNLYLSTGYTLGLSLIIALNFRNFLIKLIILNTILVLLIATAARGPILFALFSLGIYVLLNVRAIGEVLKKYVNKLFRYLLVLLLLNSFFLIYAINNNDTKFLFERSLARLDLLAGEDKGSSVSIRKDYFHFSKEMIFKNTDNFIYGYGFGSFNLFMNNEDSRGYPHNILLEIWFELGLIGLFFFFLLAVIMIFYMNSRRNIILNLCILFLFLNALKSSSLIDLRILFAFAGLLLFIPQQKLELHKLTK